MQFKTAMLYKILFSLHTFVAGIVGFSTVATLLGLASGPRLKPKEMLAAMLLFLFFAGSAYGAWRLKEQGHQSGATILLTIIWVLVIFIVLFAAGKARWN